MADGGVGNLAVLVYLGVVLASPVVAVLAWLLRRRRGSFFDALATLAAVTAGGTLALATTVALSAGPVAGAVLVAVASAAVLVLAVFPLSIGRTLLVRWTPMSPDPALGFATLGWPVALIASLLLFLAPGGLGRYNATFLGGWAAVVVWTALLSVVTFGPAVVGLGWYRWSAGGE